MLGCHVEVLLGGHGVVIHGWGHRPHGGLHVVLGSKPCGSLLAGRSTEAGGYVIHGTRLSWAFEATRAIKPHRKVQAQGSLLLEAHRSRSRTRAQVIKAPRWIKALHWALKSSWSRALAHKPHWGLLTDVTINPPGDVWVTVKPPHTVSASHWTVRHGRAIALPRVIKPLLHVWMRSPPTVKPARTWVVGTFKLWGVLVPPWRVWSGGAHVTGNLIPGGWVPSVVRWCVSWGVTVLSDRRQCPPSGWDFEDGFGGGVRVSRSHIQIEGPVIRVLTVGALKAWNRALC